MKETYLLVAGRNVVCSGPLTVAESVVGSSESNEDIDVGKTGSYVAFAWNIRSLAKDQM